MLFLFFCNLLCPWKLVYDSHSIHCCGEYARDTSHVFQRYCQRSVGIKSDSEWFHLDNSRSMSVDLWSGVTVRLQSIYPSRFLVFCCRRTSSMEDEPENVANAMHAMVNFLIWQLHSWFISLICLPALDLMKEVDRSQGRGEHMDILNISIKLSISICIIHSFLCSLVVAYFRVLRPFFFDDDTTRSSWRVCHVICNWRFKLNNLLFELELS